MGLRTAPTRHLANLALLVAGWVLVALAIAALIELDLGVAPYDVLNVGIGGLVGVAPGTAMWITGTVLVAVAWLLGERPGLATPVGFITIGALINVTLPLMPDIDSWMARAAVLLVAIAVLYLGVCLTIISTLGAGPTEVLMLAIARHGTSVRTARWIIEIGCAAIGWVANGPLGLFTVVLVVVSAPLIGAMLPLTRELLGRRTPVAATTE